MTPTDRLAALRDGNPRHSNQAERPVTVRLPAAGRVVEVPGPRTLARTFAAQVLASHHAADLVQIKGESRLFARPAGSEETPTPLSAPDAAEVVRAALATLPHRDDAGSHYRDLRLLAAAPETAPYLLTVVAWVQRLAPVWVPPRVQRLSAAKTAADYARDARARDRKAGEESAEAWLRDFLRTATPGPIAARDLYRLGEAQWWRSSDGSSPRVWPGRNTFYRVADRVLGDRRALHRKTSTYTIPEPPTMPDAYATAILDRAARLLLEEARPSLNRLGHVAADSTRQAATGTDGVVVDLDARRR